MEQILQKLLEQVPAFGALCIVVVLGAKHLQKDRAQFMEFMTATMIQVREMSETCHTSHENVADRMSIPLEKNTDALNKQALAVAEMSILLKHVNGKLTR